MDSQRTFVVTIELPVARRPPHRFRRTELPHQALQEYSLSRITNKAHRHWREYN